MSINDDSKLLLLEQDLKLHKEQSDNEIHELKKELKQLDERLKVMEMSKEKTDYQYEQIMQTLKTLNEKTIPNLTAQIEELKNKPAKRYDQAVTGILGALFGAAGTMIANMFFK